MGGTESSLFRVADHLAQAQGFRVTIAQHNRRERDLSAGVQSTSFVHRERLAGPDPAAIVVLRNFKILPSLRKLYPESRFFLWMHCFPGSRWNKSGPIFEKTRTTVVAVSETLRKQMIQFLQPEMSEKRARETVVSIYNPIAGELTRYESGIEVNTDRMVFFSSPHKGLDEVLSHFQKVRSEFPDMELRLADPGYWRGPKPGSVEGVKTLGPLPPETLYREIASSLCVFYPQTSFAETFGLVFAEANTLGTPVLAHDLGAAREVLSSGGEGQIVDCRDSDEVLETIRTWRNIARPEVSGCTKFSLNAIGLQWRRLLDPSSPA